MKHRLQGWARGLLGIRADTFVSVQQVQQAGAGAGKVGQGLDSNVVMAPVQFVQRAFTQATAVVERRTERASPGRAAGIWRVEQEHRLARLLEAPNPFYDGDALTKALLLSWFLDGNAYMLKTRGELRRLAELWYVPHWLIEPRWPSDGSAFISHYDYTPTAGRGAEPIRPSDVVHLRFGLDPRNPRKGLSQIKHVLREVLTDEEASAFSAAILGNMGVPGGVIAPADSSSRPSAEDVKAMKEHMGGFRGPKRGEWLVLGSPTKIEQFGFDPNNLTLGNLRDISEERICAALGIPAAVVGFGAGLQQTKVGATMRELVRLARVNCIEPTQVSIARQLSRQLLPEFETRPERVRVRFDNSEVSAFAEDETELAKRAELLVRASIIKVTGAQEMVGVEVDPDRDVYLTPSGMAPVGQEPTPPRGGELEEEDEDPAAGGAGTPPRRGATR